ncbi:hypothetical protein QUF82_18575 [Thiotrichales bacterium HSG14]|nr:hypothetical protein [Thiotrichales bacterium HSG14]
MLSHSLAWANLALASVVLPSLRSLRASAASSIAPRVSVGRLGAGFFVGAVAHVFLPFFVTEIRLTIAQAFFAHDSGFTSHNLIP